MPFRFLKETSIATCILFGFALLISLIPIKFDFVKPIKQEFDDFDIYDLFYTGKSKEHPGVKDTNIIIIQAAYSRSEIDSQIIKIKSLKPAVLGIDLSFDDSIRSINDLSLISSIIKDSNVVAGYTLDVDSENDDFVKEKLLPKEYLIQHGGYINFSHKDSNAVLRAFAPFYKHKDNEFMAFSTRIAQKFSAEKFDILKKRKNKIEFINYSGNIEYYLNYSASQFDYLYKTQQLGNIKGKIVLLGGFSKLNDPVAVMEDIKFTPINEKANGRGFPDMYGVVIHANIISMILGNGDYIKSPSACVSYLISFCLCFLVICLIYYWHIKYSHPSHIRLFIFQLISIISIVYLFLKFYDWFNLRIDILFIILSIVVSIEMFDLYKKIAVLLKKHLNYDTIFSQH